MALESALEQLVSQVREYNPFMTISVVVIIHR